MSYSWQLNLIFSFGYKVIEAVRLARCVRKWGMHGKISLVCSVTSTVHKCLKYVPIKYHIFCVHLSFSSDSIIKEMNMWVIMFFLFGS